MSEKNLSWITQKPQNGFLPNLGGGWVSAWISGDITRRVYIFVLIVGTYNSYRSGVLKCVQQYLSSWSFVLLYCIF